MLQTRWRQMVQIRMDPFVHVDLLEKATAMLSSIHQIAVFPQIHLCLFECSESKRSTRAFPVGLPLAIILI